MTKDLMIYDSFDTLARAAKSLAMSGYFQDAKETAQAMAKIMAGHEMGLGPFASMNGIHIIKGRAALSANLMATLIENDPRYAHKVIEINDDVCTIWFYKNGKKIGESTFTKKDATKAGTKNMDRFPRNMLFARAMSNGARWYCTGIFGGAPVYTPEELGADVNEDGDVVGSFEVIEPDPVIVDDDANIEEVVVSNDDAFAKLIGAVVDNSEGILSSVATYFELKGIADLKRHLKELGHTVWPKGSENANKRVMMVMELQEYVRLLKEGAPQDESLDWVSGQRSSGAYKKMASELIEQLTFGG